MTFPTSTSEICKQHFSAAYEFSPQHTHPPQPFLTEYKTGICVCVCYVCDSASACGRMDTCVYTVLRIMVFVQWMCLSRYLYICLPLLSGFSSVFLQNLCICVLSLRVFFTTCCGICGHTDVNSVICYCFCPSVLVQIQWARVERTGLEVTTVWFDIKLFLVLFLSQCQP